jgi:hypothetical protein
VSKSRTMAGHDANFAWRERVAFRRVSITFGPLGLSAGLSMCLPRGRGPRTPLQSALHLGNRPRCCRHRSLPEGPFRTWLYSPSGGYPRSPFLAGQTRAFTSSAQCALRISNSFGGLFWWELIPKLLFVGTISALRTLRRAPGQPMRKSLF